METMMQAWRIPAIAAAVAVVGCLSGPAAAQLDSARDTVNRTTAEGAQSQERIDDIAGDTEELVRNYRGVLRDIEELQGYNQQRRELIEAQMAEMDSIREQIERVKTIERDIVPLTLRMIEGLKLFVDLDVPFLIDDRQSRIARLEEVMGRSDVTIAEKFRLVLEAYQIENDYGRTIEAYTAQFGEGADRREVDFLMIGRVGFYYQTLDREETAIWNQTDRQWEILDDSYSGNVRTAMDMAREFIPPELLILPIYGPTEGGSREVSVTEIVPPAPVVEEPAEDEAEDAADGEDTTEEDAAGEAGDDAASDSEQSN